DLGESCLSGTINSNTTIFRLVYLQKLNLSYSYYLDGQIPSEILKLTDLRSLDLSENLALKLKKPNLLDLVQNLTKLENLNLNDMNILAPIPNILSHLSSLWSLSLRDCDLRDEFPSTIFTMPS